jgi:hypothetical protein
LINQQLNDPDFPGHLIFKPVVKMENDWLGFGQLNTDVCSPKLSLCRSIHRSFIFLYWHCLLPAFHGLSPMKKCLESQETFAY